MKDWATGLSILAAAFGGTVLLTIGLVAVIVPGAFGAAAELESAAPSGEAVDRTPPPVGQAPTAVGGTLTVSGDAEGTLELDRENAEIGFEFDDETSTGRLEDGPYQLIGEEGRISFAANPLVVEQIDFSGLSFYPDPEDCEITAGALNTSLGIATAALRCEEIADIRDNGVVTFDGTIMAAGDVLGMRGELPTSGGSLSAGPESLVFSEARLLLEPFGFDADTGLANLPLFTPEGESGLIIEYDPHTHELALGTIVVGGEPAELTDGACSVTRTDLGLLNPRTSVVELTVACAAVGIPELGSVAVDGSLVVDLIGIDEPP